MVNELNLPSVKLSKMTCTKKGEIVFLLKSAFLQVGDLLVAKVLRTCAGRRAGRALRGS